MSYSKIKKQGSMKAVLLGGFTMCKAFLGEESENFMV